MQDVAADGIGDFDSGGRIGEFAGVARGLEMVEEDGGEHGESIAAGRAVRKVERKVNAEDRKIRRTEESDRKSPPFADRREGWGTFKYVGQERKPKSHTQNRRVGRPANEFSDMGRSVLRPYEEKSNPKTREEDGGDQWEAG